MKNLIISLALVSSLFITTETFKISTSLSQSPFPTLAIVDNTPNDREPDIL